MYNTNDLYNNILYIYLYPPDLHPPGPYSLCHKPPTIYSSNLHLPACTYYIQAYILQTSTSIHAHCIQVLYLHVSIIQVFTRHVFLLYMTLSFRHISTSQTSSHSMSTLFKYLPSLAPPSKLVVILPTYII